MSEQTHEEQNPEQAKQEPEVPAQPLPNVMAYSVTEFIDNLYTISSTIDNIPILTNFLEFSAPYLFINITNFTQEQVLAIWQYFFPIIENISDQKLIEYICQTLRVLLLHTDVKCEQLLTFLADPDAPNDKIKPYLLHFLHEFWPDDFIFNNAGNFINLIMIEIPQCNPQWIPQFLNIVLEAKPAVELLGNYWPTWEYLIGLICNMALNQDNNYGVLRKILHSLCAIRDKFKDFFTQRNQIVENCMHQIMDCGDPDQMYVLLIKFLNLIPIFSEKFLNLVVKILVRMTDSYIIENRVVPPGITKCNEVEFNEYSCWYSLITRLRYKMHRRHALGATLLLSQFVPKIFDKESSEEYARIQENSEKILGHSLTLAIQRDAPLQPIMYSVSSIIKYCTNTNLLLTTYFPLLQANYQREDAQKIILQNIEKIMKKCDRCHDSFSLFIFGALEGIMPANLEYYFKCVERMILISNDENNSVLFDDILKFMIHLMTTAQFPINAYAMKCLDYILYREPDTIGILIENGCLDFIILLLQSENIGDFSFASEFVYDIMDALDDIQPFREKLLIAYTEIVKIIIGVHQVNDENGAIVRCYLQDGIKIMKKFNENEETKLPDEYLIPINTIQNLFMSESIRNKSAAIHAMSSMLERFDYDYIMWVFESCVQWMKVTPDNSLVGALDYLATKILKMCTEVPGVLIEYYVSTMISRFAYYQSRTFEVVGINRKDFFKGINEMVRLGLTWFIPATLSSLKQAYPSKYEPACDTIEYFIFHCNPSPECIDQIFNAVGEIFSENYHNVDSWYIGDLLTTIYLAFNIENGFESVVENLVAMYEEQPNSIAYFFDNIVKVLARENVPIENANIDTMLLKGAFTEMSNINKHYQSLSYKDIIPFIIELLHTNAEEVEIVAEIGIFLSNIFLLSNKQRKRMIGSEPIEGIVEALDFIGENFKEDAKAVWDHYTDDENRIIGEIFSKFFPTPL